MDNVAKAQQEMILGHIRSTGRGCDVTLELIDQAFPDETPTHAEVAAAVAAEICRPAGGRSLLDGRTSQREKIRAFCAEHGLTTMEVTRPSGIPVLRFVPLHD